MFGFVIDEDGNLYREADIQRGLQAANDFMASLRTWFDETFVPAIQKLADAFSRFADTLASAIRDAFKPLGVHFGDRWLSALDRVPWEDRELVFRAYAARYNARHPRRKVTWRRLNRLQREAAAWDYPALA